VRCAGCGISVLTKAACAFSDGVEDISVAMARMPAAARFFTKVVSPVLEVV
jgi:hypothetical protein